MEPSCCLKHLYLKNIIMINFDIKRSQDIVLKIWSYRYLKKKIEIVFRKNLRWSENCLFELFFLAFSGFNILLFR